MRKKSENIIKEKGSHYADQIGEFNLKSGQYTIDDFPKPVLECKKNKYGF